LKILSQQGLDIEGILCYNYNRRWVCGLKKRKKNICTATTKPDIRVPSISFLASMGTRNQNAKYVKKKQVGVIQLLKQIIYELKE